ncbi:MAG: hypothetical protein ACRDV0_00525 [Acidimicrobiales bacterium]
MSHGLAPRPSLPDDDMAALVAAAEQVMSTMVTRAVDPVSPWRFSGRWFSAGPLADRRPRRA